MEPIPVQSGVARKLDAVNHLHKPLGCRAPQWSERPSLTTPFPQLPTTPSFSSTAPARLWSKPPPQISLLESTLVERSHLAALAAPSAPAGTVAISQSARADSSPTPQSLLAAKKKIKVQNGKTPDPELGEAHDAREEENPASPAGLGGTGGTLIIPALSSSAPAAPLSRDPAGGTVGGGFCWPPKAAAPREILTSRSLRRNGCRKLKIGVPGSNGSGGGCGLMAHRPCNQPPTWRPQTVGAHKAAASQEDQMDRRQFESLKQMHKAETARQSTRLKTFDKRQERKQEEMAASAAESRIEDRRHSDMAARSVQLSGGKSPSSSSPLVPALASGGPELFTDAFELDTSDAQDEMQEVELRYKVLRVSSQRRAQEIDLSQPGWYWETAPMCVHNEWVIIEFEQATQVTALQFCLPNDDSTPRHCAVAFSKESPNGPWKDAWVFHVPNRMAYSFRSQGNYSEVELARSFVALCVKVYGSLHEAWTSGLDVNGDGNLSYQEFTLACRRLSQLLANNGESLPEFNVQKVFTALDSDGNGGIGLDDLEHLAAASESQAALPEAKWWRLMIRRNFGDAKHIQMIGPLRFFNVTKVAKIQLFDQFVGEVKTSGISLQKGPSILDPLSFDMDDLELNDSTVTARRLGKKLGISLVDVELVQGAFDDLDKTKKGRLEASQFKELLLRLTGRSADQVTESRLKFFWLMANRDLNGEITLEEMLIFLQKYGQDLAGPKSSRLTLLAPGGG